jgi:hypothetical protein
LPIASLPGKLPRSAYDRTAFWNDSILFYEELHKIDNGKGYNRLSSFYLLVLRDLDGGSLRNLRHEVGAITLVCAFFIGCICQYRFT